MPRTSTIKILALSLGLSTLLSSSLALSQSPAAKAADPGPPAAKIGVVNIQEAISTSNEGKKESDALQQKFGPKQAELKTLNDEVENLKKQYQAQEAKLSDEEKGNRAKVIETKSKTLQRIRLLLAFVAGHDGFLNVDNANLGGRRARVGSGRRRSLS